MVRNIQAMDAAIVIFAVNLEAEVTHRGRWGPTKMVSEQCIPPSCLEWIEATHQVDFLLIRLPDVLYVDQHSNPIRLFADPVTVGKEDPSQKWPIIRSAP